MNAPGSTVDYAGLYDAYWSRPDRFGEHSFTDAGALAHEILRACGRGSIVDVGCGMGLLVRTLLSLGVDAHGVDVSRVSVEHGNRLAPGCFDAGSILALPFADGAFETVVSTDCLEHLARDDVPLALREMHRVARRNVYVRLATTPDRDGQWHLTVEKRGWWEDQLFAAGFRKHPRAMAIVPYEALERDEWQITLIFEKLAAPCLAAHPLDRLLVTRDLHMDMLRETGRRSDAHVARYHLAAAHVRPGDVVLDVACGLGYGAAVVAANTRARRVIGVDLDQAAIAYARDTTGSGWPQTEFHAGDATALAFLADRSVDFVTSFETLEHLPDPGAFLTELHRVLKPAGRVVVSVPNLWVDASGVDPNPHHLHVYDWARLRRELAVHFEPEAVWAQTAGGGMKLTTRPRRIATAALRDPTASEAEWWLAMAMKSPLGAPADDYRETSYPAGDERPHVTAFGRDYANPWLVKAMVALGQRSIDDALLAVFANGTLDTAPVGSCDAGAALCVLGYQWLHRDDVTAADIDAMVQRIETHLAVPPANPNAFRWHVSLLFVAARLRLRCGHRAAARALLERCAALDCKAYSPILGTKTIESLRLLGTLAAAAGDADAARAAWQRALTETQRLLQGSWWSIHGDPASPVPFGLVEAAELLDLTAGAAYALVLDHAHHPGLGYEVSEFSPRAAHRYLERDLAGVSAWAARLRHDLAIAAQETAQVREELAAERQRSADLAAQLAAQPPPVPPLPSPPLPPPPSPESALPAVRPTGWQRLRAVLGRWLDRSAAT